jgi:hypothetical protein
VALQSYLPYALIFIGAVLSAGGAVSATLKQDSDTRELLGEVTGGESLVYLQPLRTGGRVSYSYATPGSIALTTW